MEQRHGQITRDTQSTEKRIFITCFGLRTKNDLWTNLRIFSYSVRLLPPPPPDPTALSRLAAFRARQVNFFGYYSKSQDFSEFRLGNLESLLSRLDAIGEQTQLTVVKNVGSILRKVLISQIMIRIKINIHLIIGPAQSLSDDMR